MQRKICLVKVLLTKDSCPNLQALSSIPKFTPISPLPLRPFLHEYQELWFPSSLAYEEKDLPGKGLFPLPHGKRNCIHLHLYLLVSSPGFCKEVDRSFFVLYSPAKLFVAMVSSLSSYSMIANSLFVEVPLAGFQRHREKLARLLPRGVDEAILEKMVEAFGMILLEGSDRQIVDCYNKILLFPSTSTKIEVARKHNYLFNGAFYCQPSK